MPPKNLYAILGVKKTATAAEIKHAFRELARKYHPDTNAGDDVAAEAFKELAAAYEVLGDPVRRKEYDKSGSLGPVTIPSKQDKYFIQKQAWIGDVADLYVARAASTNKQICMKVTRSARDNDLLENESKKLKEVYPLSDTNDRYKFYLPEFVETFKLDDGKSRRRVNILEWLPDYYSLEEVRRAHPNLQMEHGVWMFNRMLEILGYVHRKKLVHGAVLPPHVLVFGADVEKHKLNHGARLVGWSYCTRVGEKIKAISQQYKNFYPGEVFRKEPATPATDIYMAASTALYAMGGEPHPYSDRDKTLLTTSIYPSHIPSYLVAFLKGCMLKNPKARPQDAWELHKELKEHMAKHYGPKKYVKFHMPLPA